VKQLYVQQQLLQVLRHLLPLQMWRPLLRAQLQLRQQQQQQPRQQHWRLHANNACAS
jgi:hypothetical protein